MVYMASRNETGSPSFGEEWPSGFFGICNLYVVSVQYICTDLLRHYAESWYRHHDSHPGQMQHAGNECNFTVKELRLRS
jgi:hypothetical protein